MAEVFHRRTNDKHAWGNVGVDYASPLLTANELAMLNAGIRRVTSDAAAVRYLRRFYEPNGRTRSKVLTVHAHDDGLVLVENETEYRQAFEAVGNADRLVQLYTDYAGHCGFIAELFSALTGITGSSAVRSRASPRSAPAARPAGSRTPFPDRGGSRWSSACSAERRSRPWRARTSRTTARRAAPAVRNVAARAGVEHGPGAGVSRAGIEPATRSCPRSS